MYYCINVSQAGRHLFVTAKHSCQSAADMKRVWAEINKRFPAAEGFAVVVTRWENYGTGIDPEVVS